MRSVMIAAVVGLLVGLLANELATLMLVAGFVVVVVGLLLTMTALGAVIGIPLMLVGGVEMALAAATTGGTQPALVLGLLGGLATYAHLRRRAHRATA